MPNYIGGKLQFNSDGSGTDMSIPSHNISFSYRLTSENGDLILDVYDYPKGTGTKGAKYYVITANLTTLILNEYVTFFNVKRYAECRRK